MNQDIDGTGYIGSFPSSLSSKKVRMNYRYMLSALLLSFFVIASCSDSETTVGPDPAEESKITIQGSVSGPADAKEKSLAVNKKETNLEISESDSSMTPPGIGMWSPDAQSANLVESTHSMAESILSGEVPLTDISVSLYEASDYISNQNNATLLASTTTDSEGNYLFSDIDEGLDLVIIVDSNPRLTSVITGAVEESNGAINSATAIVSEYWAGEIANGRVLDQADFNEMLKTAGDLMEIMSADELYDVLVELVPDQFGDGFPGNLSINSQFLVNSLLGFNNAVCEAIIFDEAAGKPTNYVLVEGLSDDFGQDPLAWVYDSEEMDEDSRHGVYIERLNGNEAELLIPIHPVNYLGGGSAVIVIYNEDQSIICPGISFEIEALEKAPGTFKDMVDNLEDVFEGMVQNFGYSTSDELLTADVSELPDEVKPLAAALQIIGGPGNPDNLRQILSGDAPILEGEPLDREAMEVIDALVNESGLFGMTHKFDELFNAQAKRVNKSSNSAGCFVMPENISTPGELDCWMGVQAWFENQNQGLSRQINDLTGAALGVGAVVALATGAGAPLAAALGMSATAVTMMAIFIDSNDHTLPSNLLGLEVWADPEDYPNEDDDTEGVWSADLGAESKGWTLNWATTVGNIPGLGKVAGILNKTNLPNAAQFLLQNFQRDMNKIWRAESGPIVLPPKITRVTVNPKNDEDYFNWKLNTKTSETSVEPFLFTLDQGSYIPQAVGVSELKVETKGGNAFKGQHVFNSIELEVEAMNVSLAHYMGDGIEFSIESSIYMQVQEEVLIEAVVRNALNKEVEWAVTPDGEGLNVTRYSGADNVVEVSAVSPGSYTLEAETTADTGPRADRLPRRYDRVRIVVGDLRVSNPVCVETGDTYQLTASIGGESVEFSKLEWDIDGSGSISPEGLFTAGGEGSVQIDFQVKDRSRLNYSISFDVRRECSYINVSSQYFNETNTCPAYATIPPPEGRFEPDRQEEIDKILEGIMDMGEEGMNAMNDVSVLVGWSGPFIGLPLMTDLEEAGEWTKTLVLSSYIEDNPLLEWLFMMEDSQGVFWMSTFGETYSELKITREEMEVDGETVPVFSGTFYTTITSEFTEFENPRGATVHGEFKGIREWGCIPGEFDSP